MKLKTPKAALPPLLKQICHALEEKKAEDIKVLCVKAQSSITDYLVLGTGTSEPHLRALRVELDQGSGWLVVDAFDIMVHVFTPENRKKYALESLWKDAEEISLTAKVAPVKASPAKKHAAAKPKKAVVKKAKAKKKK
jgi:ribosome-associated protein